MNFYESMEFVEREHGFPRSAGDLHGKRTAWLLRESGLYDRLSTVPHVVIAGTCGKASTAIFLASMVRELFSLSGYNRPVGLGVKPPLHEDAEGSRERYQLLYPGDQGGRWIGHEEFAALVSGLEPLARRYEKAPHLGELASYDLRAAVLAGYFADREVGLGIFEANIGLRDDYSSALPMPSAIALSLVGEAHLGQLLPPPELPDVLRGAGLAAGPILHKAGGLRKGVPALIGCQRSDYMPAICEVARKTGAAPLLVYGIDFSLLRSRSTIEGSRAAFRVGEDTMEIAISLPGRFQVENALLAAATVYELHQQGVLPGTSQQLEEAICRGARDTGIPGRLQVLGDNPVVIASPAAAAMKWRSAISTVEELMEGSEKKALVIGATFLARDEDSRDSLEALLSSPRVRALFPSSHPPDRDMVYEDPEKIAAWCRERRPGLLCVPSGSSREALRHAMETADPRDDVILLLGKGMGDRPDADSAKYL
jgi:folylpolyglutamate synthase/dihydropteroate synthase